MKIQLSEEILGIISRLEYAGHEAYVVGGSLRDALLGKESSDTDLTASALPEETAALFSDMRVIPTGIKHGTVTVLTNKGTAVEITTFRTDGEYSDSRHPDSVSFTRSLPEDLARRDFTVNAMAYAPEKGIVDLFGGREDLEKRCIRCVGDPAKRFSEDALRILRAFRFSAQLGFSIEKNTLKGAIDLGDRLSVIARERVRVELFKLLSAPKPADALMMMSPIMRRVIPEVGIDEARFKLCDELAQDPIVRLAFLVFNSGNEKSVADGLRMSNADKARLLRLSSGCAEDIPDSPASARRLLARFAAVPEDAVVLMDILGLVSDRDTSAAVSLLRGELSSSPCLTLARLAVDGKTIISEGIAEGRRVGALLDRLLCSVIDDPVLNDRESLLALARRIVKENNL